MHWPHHQVSWFCLISIMDELNKVVGKILRRFSIVQHAYWSTWTMKPFWESNPELERPKERLTRIASSRPLRKKLEDSQRPTRKRKEGSEVTFKHSSKGRRRAWSCTSNRRSSLLLFWDCCRDEAYSSWNHWVPENPDEEPKNWLTFKKWAEDAWNSMTRRIHVSKQNQHEETQDRDTEGWFQTRLWEAPCFTDFKTVSNQKQRP